MPVALIAGVLGALGGKHGLNVIPFSSDISQYSGLLVMFLSASLFIGNRDDFSLKKTIQQAGDSFFLNCASEAGQFGLSILVGLLMSCTIFPYIFSSFGVLMPAGFVGDHGTAAVIGRADNAAQGLCFFNRNGAYGNCISIDSIVLLVLWETK